MPCHYIRHTRHTPYFHYIDGRRYMKSHAHFTLLMLPPPLLLLPHTQLSHTALRHITLPMADITITLLPYIATPFASYCHGCHIRYHCTKRTPHAAYAPYATLPRQLRHKILLSAMIGWQAHSVFSLIQMIHIDYANTAALALAITPCRCYDFSRPDAAPPHTPLLPLLRFDIYTPTYATIRHITLGITLYAAAIYYCRQRRQRHAATSRQPHTLLLTPRHTTYIPFFALLRD